MNFAGTGLGRPAEKGGPKPMGRATGDRPPFNGRRERGQRNCGPVRQIMLESGGFRLFRPANYESPRRRHSSCRRLLGPESSDPGARVQRTEARFHRSRLKKNTKIDARRPFPDIRPELTEWPFTTQKRT